METKTKTVHARMAHIKAELFECKIPKSGKNKFSGFVYHELTDFMPFINKLNAKHGINTFPKFLQKQGICVLTVVNVENEEDKYEIIIPFVEAQMLAKDQKPSVVDAIQRMGSTLTYNRRYLYMSAYDIVESDGVDPAEPKPLPTIDSKRFALMVEAIRAKKYTVKQARESYGLSDEQKEVLIDIELELA